VTTNSKLPEVCKEAFVRAREKLGLSAKDLGGIVCLSTRQIEQIENGETSSFYSAQIKVTAAKKVAKLLKLTDEQAFIYSAKIPDKLNVAQAQETHLPVARVQVKEVPFAGTVPNSKPTSHKKLLLWGSVLATAVFSAINLRPLFFADKPEEIILVKEEVVETAPSTATIPVEPSPAVTPATVTANSVIPSDIPRVCPVEEGIISYKPEAPRKPADLVYVQTKSNQIVCVMDASGKVQNKLLETGVGASFYGKPPFKVLTTGLNQMDIFFQGAKVRLSNLNAKTLILEDSEASAPLAERMDSQLR
jgi:transcriptional regulator with XRE-family HTH domain